MKVYPDLCCLKRPFDDQTRSRIALETVAVMGILKAVQAGRVQAVRSLAHDLENSQNLDRRRAAVVGKWLDQLNPPERASSWVTQRVELLVARGFRQFDALLASAPLGRKRMDVLGRTRCNLSVRPVTNRWCTTAAGAGA